MISIRRLLTDIFYFHRFLYDGNRINDDDTPASLDMEDNGGYLLTPTSGLSLISVIIRHDRRHGRTYVSNSLSTCNLVLIIHLLFRGRRISVMNVYYGFSIDLFVRSLSRLSSVLCQYRLSSHPLILTYLCSLLTAVKH